VVLVGALLGLLEHPHAVVQDVVRASKAGERHDDAEKRRGAGQCDRRVESYPGALKAFSDHSEPHLPQPQIDLPTALCSRTCAMVWSVSFEDQ